MAKSNSVSYGTEDEEDTELASTLTDSVNIFGEEQRAIFQKIENDNNVLKPETGCDETIARVGSFTLSACDLLEVHNLDRASRNHEWNPSRPFSTLEKAALDGEDLIQEQLRILDEIQGTSRSDQHVPAEDMISDHDVIQEQVRIMQDIQALLNTPGKPSFATEIRPSPSFKTCLFPERAVIEENERCYELSQTVTDKASSKLSWYQDRTLQQENGCQLRVKGTRHVHESIAAGKAVLTQCAFCGTVSQVIVDCKALYCTLCHQVSPVNETASDSEIARSIQCQEKELTCFQKIADTTDN